jgi:hypothetical protein
MRKLTQLASTILALGFLALVASGVKASAQAQPFPLHVYYASDFGQYALQNQGQNQYTFTPNTLCQGAIPGSASTFGIFNVNAPVEILDVTASKNEVVTPTAVIQTASQCGITATTSYTHNTFKLVSGTAGLQESLNNLAVATAAYPANIILDRGWYTSAAAIVNTTPAAIIAAAKGNAKAILIDQTVSPWAYYQWNGAKYVAVSGGGGNQAPTVALSTGAGTGATDTVTGAGTNIVNLTTGTTPTASATIFTETFPLPTAGGFAYAPACTVTSIGGTAYTSGTVASTFSTQAVVTFTASATAMTASTNTYSFRVSCQ